MNRISSMGRLFLLGLGLQLAAVSPALAEPTVFSTRDGAIRGYDPVSYFTEKRPVKGKQEFRHEWNGAEWFFSDEENRDLFRQDPERYAPQYGGYCAFAMSKGSYAPTDPQAWTVYEGKLYLNYSKGVRKTWSKAIPRYVERADRNWRRLHPS